MTTALPPESTPKSLNADARVVARNALSGYVTLLLGAAVGLVVTPVLVNQLGITGYGTWALICGVAAYLWILDAGIGLATTTRIASVEVEGSDSLSRVLSASFRLYLVLATAGLIVTVVVAVVFPALFDVPRSIVSEARAGFVLVGMAQCLSLLTIVWTAGLSGTGRSYLVNLKGAVIATTTTVAQAVALLLGGGILEIAAIAVIGPTCALVIFIIEVRRRMPDVRIDPRRQDRSVRNSLLSLGWRNAITSTSTQLAFGSDIVLVGLLLSPTAAAAYAIALRGYTLLQRLATSVGTSIGPTHAHAARNFTDERRFDIFLLSLSVSLALAIAFGGAIAPFAEDILQVWVGTVPPHTAQIFAILSALLILQMPGANAYQLLLNSERAGDLMRITISSALVNIVASVMFTEAVGAIGPALGSATAVILFDALYLPRRVCRLLGQPFRRIVLEVYAPLLPPLAVLGAIVTIAHALEPSGISAIVVAGVASASFLFAWSFTESGRDVRRRLAAALRG